MPFHEMHIHSNTSKGNLEPDILRALVLKKDQSTVDITRYVHASDLRNYGKLDRSYQSGIFKALRRLYNRGLVTYREAKNEKSTIARYYSLSFKGSILALKYLTRRIASKGALKALKDNKVTEEFKVGIYNSFDITLDDPDVKVEDNIIIIKDKVANIIIDLDAMRGIFDAYLEHYY